VEAGPQADVLQLGRQETGLPSAGAVIDRISSWNVVQKTNWVADVRSIIVRAGCGRNSLSMLFFAIAGDVPFIELRPFSRDARDGAENAPTLRA